MVEILRRGVERGDVRSDAANDMFAELLPAVLLYQTILLNHPLTEDVVVEVVDRIVMPVLAPYVGAPCRAAHLR